MPVFAVGPISVPAYMPTHFHHVFDVGCGVANVEMIWIKAVAH